MGLALLGAPAPCTRPWVRSGTPAEHLRGFDDPNATAAHPAGAARVLRIVAPMSRPTITTEKAVGPAKK